MSSEKRVSTQKATSDSRTDGMERMTEGYMTKICSTCLVAFKRSTGLRFN